MDDSNTLQINLTNVSKLYQKKGDSVSAIP
ncbi:hypothetical protein SPHINGO8BC_90538 [Sphingobacterium multivorum]|uniref:Uncharacterized protein n=1 Tax=Sphingobacterium multivorum TaxID=28454 RepID=A0A654DSH5_SPHMU|nr:hypothetical protein SPHINGO8BC_90538 [Sphingobacterium multivorum]